jgi:hypothetical protein
MAYAKQQLANEGIAFKGLDNGIQTCADPAPAGRRDASIEDQVRLCRERADKEGWTIVNAC